MATQSTGVGHAAKKEPIEKKRANGNRSKQKLPPLPDNTTALVNIDPNHIPPAPNWCDPYGTQIWDLLWRAGRRHLSEEHDAVLISLLVEKLQQRMALTVWLGDNPENRWYGTPSGQIVSHPAVKQIEQMDAQITGWLSMLGFSPSDRARLGLAEIRVANELDEFRRRKDASAAVRDSEPVIDI